MFFTVHKIYTNQVSLMKACPGHISHQDQKKKKKKMHKEILKEMKPIKIVCIVIFFHDN